jgi:protein ImuA
VSTSSILSPLASAIDSSLAPLRLSLEPAKGGINVGFVKRHGPVHDKPLFLSMQSGHVRPMQLQRETVLDRAEWRETPAAAMVPTVAEMR